MSQTNSTIELTEEVQIFLRQLLLMTGRELRLSRDDPFGSDSQKAGIQAIWPKLRDAKKHKTSSEARSDLFNRLLLSLGIMPVSKKFFDTVFADHDFGDPAAIEKRIAMFRTLCMLEFGNFRFGYKKLRRSELIANKWNEYFPSRTEARKRARDLGKRAAPEGLIPIGASQLFALGDLTSEQRNAINSARETLAEILSEALQKGINNFNSLKEIAKGVKLTSLIAKAGVPGAEELLDSSPVDGRRRPYRKILKSLRDTCVRVDKERIEVIQADGLQNARTYMAMHDLNVYVATSMRAPLHFTTNRLFVDGLFHSGGLARWKLRYFDPTRAFLPDRIQKGLMECLMIKRAQLTVYHAQEVDTFGKDSEAGATLAQAKPVVVFVTRLFEQHLKMKALYDLFDEAARGKSEKFIDVLVSKRLLSKSQASLLEASENCKTDAIQSIFREPALRILRELSDDQIELELIRQGYDPEERGNSELIEFTVQLIINLEKRALTFSDVHPLGLQTSPMDGVARGVIVTRTVVDTAKVVRGLLTQTLEYEIDLHEPNWLLFDKVTHSPVRVVTKDPVLTSAFWSERWGGSST